MEELNNRYIFQSLACITDHVGFRGIIKNTPQDFVVTEIDACGQSVRTFTSDPLDELGELAVKTSIPVQKPFEDHMGLQHICADDGHGQDFVEFYGGVNLPSGYLPVDTCSRNCADADEECHSAKLKTLSSLLDVSLQESLSKYACGIRDMWLAQASASSATVETVELSLGFFLDKKQRAALHSAIRQEFPFLVTASKSSELIVKPNLDYRELCHLISQEEADSFFKFLDAKLENSTYTFKPDMSKEHRTTVHHFLSKRFGKLLETKSFSKCDSSGQQSVAITVRFRARIGSSRKRPAADGLDKQEIFTAFTLRKENLETLEAISILSTELGILPSDFSYAGIKDKKAITYQAMVVKKVTPERLKELNRKIEDKAMQLSNIRSAHQHLRLGHLKGNHFDITVRSLQTQSGDSSAKLQERVAEAIQNVKTIGFVNYYGPQRFGQGQSVQSDQIGMALLKEEMVEAVKLLFTADQEDDPVNKAKRHFLKTEDAKGTLAIMPDYKVRERMVLRALNRYGVNHDGCTKGWFSIPHSMRIFYVHAYCSRIWNEAVSYRLKTYGSSVVAGDLVFAGEGTDGRMALSDRVHVITAEEEEAKKHTIQQVVLPMLGHSVVYPTNKVGTWYHEKLAKDGLQTCSFRVPSLQLNVPGCYRQIVKNLHNLSYSIVEDTEPVQVMNGNIIEANGPLIPKLSLLLSFDLDSSCYATVSLREIMKCEV